MTAVNTLGSAFITCALRGFGRRTLTGPWCDRRAARLVAADDNVSLGTISDIRRRRTYNDVRDLSGPEATGRQPGTN